MPLDALSNLPLRAIRDGTQDVLANSDLDLRELVASRAVDRQEVEKCAVAVELNFPARWRAAAHGGGGERFRAYKAGIRGVKAGALLDP